MKKYDHLGVPVPIGTIRCLECGLKYTKAPEDWICTKCDGDVSQKAGEYRVPRQDI